MRIGVVLKSMFQNSFARLRAFPKATRGNVAMIFGLALLPLCIAAGAGLDMSRAMITRVRIGAALDAAGLAVGSQPGMDLPSMQKLANEYFRQNYTADVNAYGTPTPVVVTRPAGSQTITLSTGVEMPTVLMRIVGVDTMAVSTQSEITWGQTKLWVALVLDNTGSMCEPGSQPCPTPISTSKIVALKTATHNLLNMLKAAAANNGDVLVSIVPFSKDVTAGVSHVGDSWIDWTDWEAEPATSDGTSPKPGSSVGPGSLCPWTTSSNGRKSPYGYYCMSDASSDLGSATTASKVSKVPASGLICPGVDSGNYNNPANTGFARGGHYYNGCYDSTPTSTLTTTVTSTSTKNSTATCASNKTGTCSGSTTTTTSTTTTGPTTTTATTSGYSGDSGPTTSTSTANPVVGTPVTTSTTKNGKTTYSTSVTTSTTTTTTVVTKTGAAPFNHSWVVNSHTNWQGCIMDRTQDYDIANTAPTGSAKFPAENSEYCPPGVISPLPKVSDVSSDSNWASYWTNLSTQVDAMDANGNTNQGIGLAWGWQTLTNADPYNPGVLPIGTRKVLILLTDGANTQNRWSTTASSIDSRTTSTCQAIKNDGITVYTVLVMAGSSSMLQGCASDPTKYFALTQASDIVTTFNQIGTQITNLRVSL